MCWLYKIFKSFKTYECFVTGPYGTQVLMNESYINLLTEDDIADRIKCGYIISSHNKKAQHLIKTIQFEYDMAKYREKLSSDKYKVSASQIFRWRKNNNI